MRAQVEGVDALPHSSEVALWELEAQAAKKEEVLNKERARTIEVETWLTQIEDLLCMANEKIKMVEEHATFATFWIVEKYKKLDDFEWDAAEVEADTYLVGFPNCKDKVA